MNAPKVLSPREYAEQAMRGMNRHQRRKFIAELKKRAKKKPVHDGRSR